MAIKNKIIVKIVIGMCFLFPNAQVFAGYVLPYPSYMPGNKLYTLSRVFDFAGRYWNFGNIAQVKYRLKVSDKYVVEAKTLFEYGQFLLAEDALKRSDTEFSKIPGYIEGARNRGINTAAFEETVIQASKKHSEVLTRIIDETPKSFRWTPEKEPAKVIPIRDSIEQSIGVRESVESALKGGYGT